VIWSSPQKPPTNYIPAYFRSFFARFDEISTHVSKGTVTIPLEINDLDTNGREIDNPLGGQHPNKDRKMHRKENGGICHQAL
jgi:hypothetical protein